MPRARVPEGVELHKRPLDQEFGDKTFHIQRRHVDSSRSGRVTGLNITINATAYRFDVSPGHAYTPRGDLVDLVDEGDTYTITTGIDYTSGVENYILLAYRESAEEEEAHESSGTTEATLATRTCELLAMTVTEYDALSPSTDADDLDANLRTSDLTQNAQDRVYIVGKIIGKGYDGGTGLPNTYSAGDFGTNIIQQSELQVILTATLPSPPDITGVNLKAVSSNTTVGSGTLAFDVSASEFTYTAPGDAAGAAVAFDPDAGVQELELESNDTDFTLTIEVIPELVPVGDQSDTVTVSELYTDIGAVFSPADELHRDKIGSYIPTADLPHGEGFADLAQLVGVIPQLVTIGSDYLGTAARAALPRITTHNIDSAGELTCQWEMSDRASGSIRLYTVDDGTSLWVTVNAAWQEGSNTWAKDVAGTDASKFSLDSNGLYFYTRSPDADWADSAWTASPSAALQKIHSGELILNEGKVKLNGGADTGQTDGTLVVNYGVTREPMLLSMEVPAAPSATEASSPVRIYRATASSTQTNPIEIVGNCYFDGGVWNRDETGVKAWKLELGRDNFAGFCRFAGSGDTWNDSQWDITSFDFSIQDGDLTIPGDLTADDIECATLLVTTSINATGDIEAGDDVIATDDVVAGGDFTYATPANWYRSYKIMPSLDRAIVDYDDDSLSPADDWAMVGDFSDDATPTSGAHALAVVPLHGLPNGATLTTVSVTYSTNAGAMTFTFDLKVMATNTSTGPLTSSLGTWTDNATAAITTYNRAIKSDFAHTVDESTYAYFLVITCSDTATEKRLACVRVSGTAAALSV